MSRFVIFLYGTICYLFFLATFLYAIGFIGGIAVPKSVDEGLETAAGQAVLINVLLLGLFGIQHSMMARPTFKAWWTKIIPQPAERSTYVLATCCVLSLLFWQWRPIPAVVWDITNPAGRLALHITFVAGFLIVLYASFLIDHFDLFGLRQVVLHLKGQDYTNVQFADPWLYRMVRHPLYLGFIIAFWAAPTMTQGHLLFAIVTMCYILVAIQLEERDLEEAHGDDYRRCRQVTPMIIPWPKKRQPLPEHASSTPGKPGAAP